MNPCVYLNSMISASMEKTSSTLPNQHRNNNDYGDDYVYDHHRAEGAT